MRLARKHFVVLQRTQPWVHLVTVGARVPVVRRPCQVVFHHRRHPNRAHAQLREVIQLRRHPFKVPAVPLVHLGAVGTTLQHALHVVVPNIAIREPVGHDQVHDRRFVPSVVPFAFLKMRLDVPPHLHGTPFCRGHRNRHVPSFRHGTRFQRGPNVPRQGRRPPRFHDDFRARRKNLRHFMKGGRGDQHLNASAFQVAPPSRGIDVGLGKGSQRAASQPHGNEQFRQQPVHDLWCFLSPKWRQVRPNCS